MNVLKGIITLPYDKGKIEGKNRFRMWLKKLDNEAVAKGFGMELKMAIKNPTLEPRNFNRFVDDVNSWENGTAASSEITAYITGPEKRNIRITVRNNYNMIKDDLDAYIKSREKGQTKGAAKTSQNKRDRIIRVFSDAVEDIKNNRNIDWPDLTAVFNRLYKRKSKKDINNFMEILGEEDKKIIYVNSPEDWPLKPYFEIKLTYEDDAQEDESGKKIGSIRERKDYQVIEPTIAKAIEYIEEYVEFKKKKGVKYKKMVIPSILKLQYTHGNLSKRHTDKLFISLLESHEVNSIDHMKIWLENIKRKYSVRLDLLQQSYVEQSWGKYDKPDDSGFKGYVNTSFESVPENSEVQNKKDYITEVTNLINQSNTPENKQWLSFKNETIKNIGETQGLPTDVFLKFIKGINNELKGESSDLPKRTISQLKEMYSEEELKSYKNTMSKEPDLVGFNQIKSAPHPLQSNSSIGYYTLPKGDTTYAKIVGEIYNEGINNKLKRFYNTFSKRHKVRGEPLPDIEQLFTGDSTKNPMENAVSKFSNDLEKALAYTIYDIIISDEDIQDVLIKDIVKKYRGTDINFIEAIVVLRKIEHNITKTNSLIPKLDVLVQKVKVQDVEELKQSIRQGEQIFKDEIKNIANGMEDVLSKVKEEVINLVKNKLLTIIRNQNDYQAEVKADIMNDLRDKGFIRRQQE